MAIWNNNITIEVILPYVTQGCTLGHATVKINITSEDIWLSGDSKDSLRWKAYIRYGEHPILITGKATTKDGKTAATTTHKVTAWCTCDGMTKGKEQYKAKVVTYR